MSKDILDQVVAEMKANPYLALQLDESTDAASCEQLLVYAVYIKGDSVREEFIFCKLLTTTTSGESVQNIEEFLCQ
jgi:hypothetical protein